MQFNFHGGHRSSLVLPRVFICRCFDQAWVDPALLVSETAFHMMACPGLMESTQLCQSSTCFISLYEPQNNAISPTFHTAAAKYTNNT